MSEVFALQEVKKKKPHLVETGAPGTEFFGGYLVSEEYNTDLQGEKGLIIYDKMRRSDPQVRASLYAVTLPIRQAKWEIQPASTSKRDVGIAEIVHQDLFDGMSTIWDDFIRQVLLYLTFGFMVFEKVYKIVDGKVRLKKLAPRMPRTVMKWNVADDSGLVSLVQYVKKAEDTWEERILGIKDVILFVNEQEGANYEGLSLLRSAYKSWYLKSQLEKLDAINHDRWAVGIPNIELPDGVVFDSDEYKAAITCVKGLRSHEMGYTITPFGYKITLLQMSAKGNSSGPLDSIKYHNEELAKNVLTQFLTLGTTKTGSRSLGGDFQDFFLLSIHAIIGHISSVMDKYLIREMVDQNFNDVEKYPKLLASKIESTDFVALADGLSKLTGINLLTPTLKLENHIRAVGHLPEITEEERNKHLEESKKEENPQKSEKNKSNPKNKLTLTETGKFWREPVSWERNVSLNEIVVETDRIRDQLIGKIINIQKGQFIDLSESAIKNPMGLRISKTGKLISLVYGELLTSYRFGRQQIKEEFKRQQNSLSLVDPEKQELKNIKIEQFLSDKAIVLVDSLQNKTLVTAKVAALEAIRLGLIGSVAEEFISRRLKGMGIQEAKQLAQESVLQAFSIGRNVEAKINADEVKIAYYSALMDENTCGPCRSLDLKQHKPFDPKYQTPNPNCEGRGKCRCITIYILKSEVQ